MCNIPEGTAAVDCDVEQLIRFRKTRLFRVGAITSILVRCILLLFGVISHARAGDDQPAPIASTPPAAVKTNPRLDPAYPPRIGSKYYPKESLLAHEQGRCLVKITIQTDGKTRDASITQSTGFPRLDQACLQALVPGHLIPATEDGRPVEVTREIPIVWTLNQ